jgi:hypothetical protein
MENSTPFVNKGNYIGTNNGIVNQYFYKGLPTPPPPPCPPVKSRFWLELDRIQHVTVLLAALSMLTLTVLCCWPSGQTVSALMPLVVVLSLVGTVGFGYFYYTERAFQ